MAGQNRPSAPCLPCLLFLRREFITNKAVARNQSVCPAFLVFVEVYGFPQWLLFREHRLICPPSSCSFFTVSMMVFGSMRSCTCKLTVGTSKLVCSAFPAHCSCGSKMRVVLVCSSSAPVSGSLSRCHQSQREEC